ncbi:50S ribosomal protein L10, partial [Candidatus Shapirobacteria bacterium CG07_land_8_20_14_0_80_39_18]
MKKQEKIFEVENLTAKVKEAKSVVVADYRGIKVSQMNQLRDKVREIGGELQVVKNNLFYRALDQNNYEIEKTKLDGPSLALFANNDEISPLKALANFGKTLGGLLPFK